MQTDSVHSIWYFLTEDLRIKQLYARHIKIFVREMYKWHDGTNRVVYGYK